MSPSADVSPPPAGPRDSADAAEQRASAGFTAANRGSSASTASVNANGNGKHPNDGRAVHPIDVETSDSEDSSSGKRKLPEADASATQKRLRLSPLATPTAPAAHANGNGHGHNGHKANGAAAATHTPRGDESGWAATHDRHDGGSATSDAQMAEVLKNSLSGQSSGPATSSPEQGAYQGQSGPGGAGGSAAAAGPPADAFTPGGAGDSKYGGTAQQLQLQRGSGQRKRNFSNRTKTGCLTCRERKKKCDERKPLCANCERGGFMCKGYASGGPYKATLSSQLPLQPLQNAYPPPQYAYPPHPGYYDAAAPAHPVAAAHAQPHAQDAHHRPQAYAPPQWPGAGPPHYAQDAMHRPEYQTIAAHPAQAPQAPPPPPNVASVPSMGAGDAASQHPHSMHTLPKPVHPPHIHNSNGAGQALSGYPQYGNHVIPNGTQQQQQQQYGYTNPRMTAQLALEHASTREPASEKGKMLAGFPYSPRDAELKQERFDCAQRVYRFNKNASEPGLLSESSRRDQLRQVLEPQASSGSPSGRKSPSSRSGKPGGLLGSNVEVEAPFFCEYGYNITIKDDVDIGANCRIMDASTVEIGERTIIGPDVKILTTDGQHEANRHPGQKRLLRAQKIKIGKDVFIGAGAIILPGRTIADGATIGAGTIVHHDVKGPYTFINNIGERKPKNHWAYGQPQVPAQPAQQVLPPQQPPQHGR